MTGSARVLKERVLDPLLDAQAFNEAQDRALLRLVFDPSPEIDSFLELADEIRRGRGDTPDTLATLIEAIEGLRELNGLERDAERQATGVVDELARERHRREIAGETLGVKAIAARLRGPLGVLVDQVAVEQIAAVVAAIRAIDDVVFAAAESRLRSASLRNELGAGKHRTLELLLEQTTEEVSR